MQRIHLLLLIILPSLFACNANKEKIKINTNPFEVMPTNMKQNIIIEAFVGEWTSTSIELASQIDEIKNKYQERIIPINYHSGDWLETPFTDQISTKLGGLMDPPKASINRNTLQYKPSVENGFTLLSPSLWEYQITKHGLNTPNSALSLETKLSTDGTLDVNIYIAYKEAIQGDTRLQLIFVQDSIKSSSQAGAIDNYTHQYVVQDIYPDAEGTAITLDEESEQGTIAKHSFTQMKLNNLNLMNVRIVAVLYQNNTDFRKIKVLNVQDVKLGGNKYWD